MDPSHYQVDETLRDGRPVVVRAIHGKDQQEILAAYHELDSHSIYPVSYTHLTLPTSDLV